MIDGIPNRPISAPLFLPKGHCCSWPQLWVWGYVARSTFGSSGSPRGPLMDHATRLAGDEIRKLRKELRRSIRDQGGFRWVMWKNEEPGQPGPEISGHFYTGGWWPEHDFYFHPTWLFIFFRGIGIPPTSDIPIFLAVPQAFDLPKSSIHSGSVPGRDHSGKIAPNPSCHILLYIYIYICIR